MSWGKKEREIEDEVEVAAPSMDPAPQTDTTYIDAGCEMSGTFRCRENVRIDGRIEGEIRAEKTLVVGEEAVVCAQIHAAYVVVLGTVEGDIFATGETTLHKSASVTGELQTGGIVVERGARLRGSITIGSDEGERPMPSTPSQTHPETSGPLSSSPAGGPKPFGD